MGNTHVKPHPHPRNKKQVHWKAADRPSAPGRPQIDPTDNPELVSLHWTKPTRDGGSPITGYLVEHRRTGAANWTRATPAPTPHPSLSLAGLEPGWRYQFRVSAENAVGLSPPSDPSAPLTLSYQRFAFTAPKFSEDLADATALENDKIEFEVHFFGQPPPKICWFKDGFEIFSSRRTRITSDVDRSVLTIHQSALGDEGEIKCTATNKAGHASTKAKLTIEAPPSIRLPRQYEDGLLFEIGEMVRLKVSVAGRPTPLIFWTHNGETLQNDDRYELEYIDKCSILKVGEARRSDRGEYQIKAVNKLDEDHASFLLTITDKPSPPGKARVVMTLGRSVTLTWATPCDDGGCKIGNYIVEYYRLGWDVWLKAATSRQLSTILGDLIEGSEYRFRIKAESPYGVSEPSEESDTVFIPDVKRGITTPQARSSSQPNYIDGVPVAVRRRHKSQTKDEDEQPKRPERNRIKSPPKTPETGRKEVPTILDRASIARELAYGSPDSPPKLRVDPSDSFSTSSRDTSPILRDVSSKLKSNLLRENSDNLGGSSEFMLVLYQDENETKNLKRFEFEYESIPPPISLSAPELGVEPPTFPNLRASYSSNELLHDRAIARLNLQSQADELLHANGVQRRFSYDGQHSIDIPKIQINSKDESDIIGLERKHSARRRSSGVVQQQILWAQKRLHDDNDLVDIIEAKVDTKRQLMMTRQRSESEEKEEETFEQVRAKMALHGQSSFEKRTIDIVDEDKWLEEYEESLSDEETESESEDEVIEQLEPPYYGPEDEEPYHPGAVTRKSISDDEPFEILTKKNKLPDPNFIPKPILKKSEVVNSTVKESAVKTRSHSPMPQQLRQPKQLSESTKRESISREEKINTIKSVTDPSYNISTVAQLCGIAVASIVIPEGLLRKTKDAEEAKSVVNHYGDIVRTVTERKKSITSLTSTSSSSSLQQVLKSDTKLNKKSLKRLVKQERAIETLHAIISDGPTPLRPEISRVGSPQTERLPNRGRTINRSRKNSHRSKTPLKSPTRLENWSTKRNSSTSTSPMKLVASRQRKSPSPIPLARPRPTLREIMTQTSFRMETNGDILVKSRSNELAKKVNLQVRSVFDYVTDLAMFLVACWLYVFSNELLSIPILLIMVYRQLANGVKKRIPKWILKRYSKPKNA